jgi:hypothetical protein
MKKFLDPTIPLQMEMGNQIYGVLNGSTMEFVRQECEGEYLDDRAKERRERNGMMIEENVVPDIYKLCQQAKDAVGFKQNIDFYLVSDADVNAGSIESNAPDNYPHIIELNAGLVNLMSKQELLFVIGHEIGHLINGDGQLKKLTQFIYADKEEDDIPDFVSHRLELYDLLCELGADRYGYIACGGDLKTSILVIHKLAAGIDLTKMNISVDALIKENQKHLDYFMGSNKSVGSTHPVHPIRIQSLYLFSTAESQDQLEKSMEDIEDRLNKLNEEDATLNYFYAAAGYLLSNVNGEASTLQKQTIVYRVGGKCWFPEDFINYVIENKNIEELYHDTIKLLVEMDEENKIVMMDFLLALAFVDGCFTKKELDFIYDFGHEVGYTDDLIAGYIKELLPRNFRLNLTV